MFKNCKIGTKLFLSFMLIASLLVFIGAVGFNLNRETSIKLQKLSELHEHNDLYEAIQLHSQKLTELDKLMNTDLERAKTSYMESIRPQFNATVLTEMRSLQKSMERHEHEMLDVRLFLLNGEKTILSLTIIPFLMAIILGSFLTYTLSAPILDARDFATKIAFGDTDIEIDTSRMDEIGELMRSIDKMRLIIKAVVADGKRKP